MKVWIVKKCGAHISDGDMFCGECGAKVEVNEQINISNQNIDK